MTAEKQPASKSWWGYGVAAVYTLFALATLGFVAFTMTQKVELVSKDYYAKELAYEQQIERLRRTSAMPQQVTCLLSNDGKFVDVRFPDSMKEVTGTLTFYRPSESSLDRDVPLTLDATGRQLVPTEKLMRGLWRVRLEWQAQSLGYYKEFELMIR